MSTIDAKTLQLFKSHYPHNPQIQALTLDEVLKHTQGKTADWNNMYAETDKFYQPLKQAAAVTANPCYMNVGYVIFDVICLALGAVSLRKSVSAATIANTANAVTPVLSEIEKIIVSMSKAGATKSDLAWGVFNILRTIYAGGCLGAVFSAFTASLTWWNMILYGVTGMATIVAALATDGLALAAEVIGLLASFGFLATDCVAAYTACSLPAPPQITDGARIRDTTDGRIYLTLDGALSWIPDAATYVNLFISWSNVTAVPNVDDYVIAEPLTKNASLINGSPDGKIYLLLESGKRWITSPAVFNAFQQ